MSDEELLHTRDYNVTVHRRGETELVVRGSVKDSKPADNYFPGETEPWEPHHMSVDMVVTYPSYEIKDIAVEFAVAPHHLCAGIADHYRSLVGASVTRGYAATVRSLFGGPRGCSHVTALLLAMGPAVNQATWTMRVSQMRRGVIEMPEPPRTPAERRARHVLAVNSCHVWDEHGEVMTAADRGDDHDALGAPLNMRSRMAARGEDANEWQRRYGFS